MKKTLVPRPVSLGQDWSRRRNRYGSCPILRCPGRRAWPV